MDVLRCPSCLLLLWEPVTVSCGHTVCKGCLGGPRCPLCQERLKLLGVGAARSSVVLCGLLEKCVPLESRLAGLVARVRDRLTRGDAQEALRMAQRGVELGKHHRDRGAAGFGVRGWAEDAQTGMGEQVDTNALCASTIVPSEPAWSRAGRAGKLEVLESQD